MPPRMTEAVKQHAATALEPIIRGYIGDELAKSKQDSWQALKARDISKLLFSSFNKPGIRPYLISGLTQTIRTHHDEHDALSFAVSIYSKNHPGYDNPIPTLCISILKDCMNEYENGQSIDHFLSVAQAGISTAKQLRGYTLEGKLRIEGAELFVACMINQPDAVLCQVEGVSRLNSTSPALEALVPRARDIFESTPNVWKKLSPAMRQRFGL